MEVDHAECAGNISDSHNETESDKTIEAGEKVSALTKKEVQSYINKSEQSDREACTSEINSGKNEKVASTSGEAKNNSLENEDLMDICIVRNMDEDNAAVLVEYSNELINFCEKYDYNEQDEMDEDDNINSSYKNMEFEEDETSSILYGQGTTSNDESIIDATINKDFDNDSNSACTKCDSVSTSDTTERQDDKTSKAASQNKRPLGAEEPAPKKMHLPTSVMVKSLGSFRYFMRFEKVKDKLTRSGLEEFALQKIAEAIMHDHEIDDMLQKMKRQEQISKNLKKDVQQLAKQAKDIYIINKKLINELRTQDSNRKPLVPIKFTRSVGLQVNSNDKDNPRIRKTLHDDNNNVQNTPWSFLFRQLTSSGKTAQSPQQQYHQATTPILTQSWQQNTQAIPPTAIAAIAADEINNVNTKLAASAEPDNPRVIDLTDEDKYEPAKLAQAQPQYITTMYTVAQPSVGYKVISKSTPQSTQKNITLKQVKPYSVVPPSANGKKRLQLNFQPSNGVLTLNESAVSVISKPGNSLQKAIISKKHLTALPRPPAVSTHFSQKPPLPKPVLSIQKNNTDIVLHWNMPYNLDLYDPIASYQIFVYRKSTSPSPPPSRSLPHWPSSTEKWREVGDVKALLLPMCCTLTGIVETKKNFNKNKYYFAMRSVDVHERLGAFSDPKEIIL